MAINRGEIYFVSLDPVIGRELGGNKRRPVMVLSINDINTKPLVVTVVPGTSEKSRSRPYPNIVRVEPDPRNGLNRPTLFLCHQIRAIDHGRFTGPPVGVAAAEDLLNLEKAVKFNLGFDYRTFIQ